MTLLFLESYGKAVVVKGDTRPVKDFLKEKGGKWNKGLVGWIFPGSRRAQLMEDLKSNGSSVEDRTGGAGDSSGSGPGAAAAQPRPASAKAVAPAAGAPAAQKRVAPLSTTETVVEIGDKLRGTISTFNGSVGVDVRRFWEDRESGELKPTAKGVRLQAKDWEGLLALVPEIESLRLAAGAETLLKIGEELFVRVGEGGKSVDVRRFYTDKGDGEQKPTKKGIFMSPTEWNNLRSSAEEISAALRGDAAGQPPQPAQRKAKTEPAPKPVQSKVDVVATSPPPEHGSSAHLREQLVSLLKGRDLQTVSLKSMRAELETSLSLEAGALNGRKEEVKGIITDLLKRGVP